MIQLLLVWQKGVTTKSDIITGGKEKAAEYYLRKGDF